MGGDDSHDGAADGSPASGDDGPTGDDDGSSDGSTPTDGSMTNEGGTITDAGHDADADAGPPTANVHFYGRMDTSDDAGPKFDWSGAGATATFHGSGVSVTLSSTDTSEGNNELEVVIDGNANSSATVLAAGTTQTISLATGLGAGTGVTHIVEIYKRTEAAIGAIQFLGFHADTGDTSWSLIPTVDPLAGRHIEFIGDSITCGYGVLGFSNSTSDTCSPTNDNENEYAAYGADVARTLSAAHSVVAFSGKGVYRDANGTVSSGSDPQIPALYTRTLYNESTSSYGFAQQMDAVVINLGTNDFAQGDPGQTNFEGAFVTFLRTIRSKYAHAYILLVSGPMITESNTFPHAIDTLNGYLSDVVTTMADSSIATLALGSQDCDTEHCGCADHPSVTRQQTMAASVVSALRTAKGW